MSSLTADALAGGDVIIARGNVPVPPLVPPAPRRQRRFGVRKGRIAIDARFDEGLPEDALRAWTIA